MIIEIVTCLMYLKTMLYEACIVYAILIKEKKKNKDSYNICCLKISETSIQDLTLLPFNSVIFLSN